MSDLPVNKLIPEILDKLDEEAVKAEKTMKKARTELIIENPFFGGLALKLKLAPTLSLPTMGTDGKKLYYNPLFTNHLSFDEVVGVVCHEVYHTMFMHPLRLYEREIMKWNVACDYAINLLIKDMTSTNRTRMRLPEGGLLDEKWRGMSADEIYDKLPDPPKQKQSGGEGKDGGEGSNDGSGNDGGGKQSPIGGGDQDNQMNDKRGCGGLVMPHDEQGRPLDKAQRKFREQETKQQIAAAAQMAKAAGNLPGELEKFIEEIMQPKINWRDQLMKFVENVASSDYSWQRPERRYIFSEKYICSLYSESIPHLAIIVDSSGSTWIPEVMQEFANTLWGISNAIDIERITVIYVDTRVNGEPEEYTRSDLPITFHNKGGGGTDFRPGFKWLEKQGETPSCLIYLTDLYCNSFPDEPEYPVLWACYQEGGHGENDHVPFGEVIDINAN